MKSTMAILAVVASVALMGCATTGSTTNQPTVSQTVQEAKQGATTMRDTADAARDTTHAVKDTLNTIKGIFGR